MSEVSLRVLYTVNTSPQYILAKAPHKIPFASADSSSPSESRVKHGRASLRACAAAICRSSPELRPDATKDFSVYILDPLEDLISKNRHGQSGGVAVGMGLLSTILAPYTPDTSMVAGTFVDCGQEENALEVVISLRQVAPPILQSVDGCFNNATGPQRTRSNSKHVKSDQPYLTSNPLPLPSFNESLFASYAQPQSQKVPSKARKPDPAHLTRAHQLPTPYIGPPKRKYLRAHERNKGQGNNPGRDSTDDSLEIPSSQGTEGTNDSSTPEPTSSDLSTGSDTESVASSSTIRPGLTSQPPDVSEAAVMLAALSSVSSKTTGKEALLPKQEGVTQNPELVSFLRAYLAYLEAQQGVTRSSEAPPMNSSPPATSRPTTGSSRNPDPSEDKENRRPQRPTEPSKGMKMNSPDQALPLGSGRFNAKGSEEERRDASTSKHDPLLGGCSRKRKLSNATPFEQDSQARRRSSSVSLVKSPDEDLSGIRLNRGWGGLRVRSDGTLWGEQPPITVSQAGPPASSTGYNGKPVLFRPSVTSTMPIRKGPYVVPDWAKGVPPPAPPPRPEATNDGKDHDGTKLRRQVKPKGLNRLGGRAAIKRAASLNMEIGALSTLGRPTSLTPHSQSKSATQGGLHSSASKSTRRSPIFAYSSPIGKSRLAALFQAFQTSPCRPASIRKSPLLTPLKLANTSPSGSTNRSSLFTPSPSITKMGSALKANKLFAEDDMPPSPTPTKKAFSDRKALTVDGSTSAGPTLWDEENINLQSSLPIASSDNALDSGNPLHPPSTSPDSTTMDHNKAHDWSSLDLPPSSPPPLSSPSMEGSDLPCSDTPSSDLSDVESPAARSDTAGSSYPSPAEGLPQPSFAESTNADLQTGICLVDAEGVESIPDVTDAFPPLFEITGEEGPSARAAFEALENGLGQEDFSEGWNLLNSLFGQVPTATNSDAPLNDYGLLEDQIHSWIPEACDPVSDFDFASSPTFGLEPDSTIPTFEAFSDQEPASIVATNLKDLLDGCLV